ncbi:MAG: aldo/keto reductase [Candidatus Omnitrophica bacterium]|nr:aldo/keto reductase [Candidatus Omnitrophota bacterium]
MLTKPLGKTSIRIPLIVQGMGDLSWDSQGALDGYVSLLRRGIEHGLNCIDTAETYGQGVSEEIVGKAIRGMRDKVLIATKFSAEHSSFRDVLKAAEGSLKRLGTDRIDLYQVHWSNPTVPIAETMGALKRLADTGKVRCVGVCNYTLKELKEAQEALGEERIASFQGEYNLFERTIKSAGFLRHLEEGGITMMAYSPLANAHFSAMESGQLNVLRSIAEKHSKTVTQVILRWIVSEPSVVAIVRTSCEAHLLENARSADFELTAGEIDRIERAFPFEITHVPTDRIRVSAPAGEGRSGYRTVEEAVQNRGGFVPAPTELAEAVKRGDFLKPVQLECASEGEHDYELVGGRIRYWAWVIAHGGRIPIPAIVRNSRAKGESGLRVSPAQLDGVRVITPPTVFEDFRGTYVETYNEKLYREAGIDVHFVQDDISCSARHVLRGIHGDGETWKLVSCLAGEFYLVVVNQDKGSGQYGRWQSFILSEQNKLQVLIPPKFGNGHLVLSERAIFHYKQSTYYNRAGQFTLRWNDPKLKIRWPVQKPILSERDEGSNGV